MSEMDTEDGFDDSENELGSLSQETRKKSLGQARGIMIVIGVLTILANGVLFAVAESQVREAIKVEVQQRQNQGLVVDQAEIEKLVPPAVRVVQLSGGLFCLLGITFIVMGIAIYKAPVPITITAMILYLGGWAVSIFFDPTMIFRGILIKIIFIAILGKAISAAVEYQNEANLEAAV